MKLKLTLLLTTLFVLLSINASAQKSEVKISYGDALAFEVSEGIGNLFIDAFDGNHSDTRGYGTFSAGYRYSVNRFSFGADLSYIPFKTDVRLKGSMNVDYRSDDNYLVVLPTADYKYLERGYVKLYGSLGAGMVFGHSSYKGKTVAGKKYVDGMSSNSQTAFAFQITPIGIRVGNDLIGGFAEIGFGMKSFVCAGLSITF